MNGYEANSLLNKLDQRCMKHMQDLEPALHNIAGVLLKHETIPGSEVVKAVKAILAE